MDRDGLQIDSNGANQLHLAMLSPTGACGPLSDKMREIPLCRSRFDSLSQHRALALGEQGCDGVHLMFTAMVACLKGISVVACTKILSLFARPLCMFRRTLCSNVKCFSR